MKELQSAAGYKSPEGEGQPKEIETKKIVAALLTALEHKLGRSPTTQELVEALSEKDSYEHEQESQNLEEQASLPSVFNYKLYYGLKNNAQGMKEPDPGKVLYYGNDSDTSWFDVDHGAWSDVRPQMLDHLNCRNMGDSEDSRDIFDCIINGVMSDDDYNLLSSKQGMLDPRCEKAYQLQKQAKDQFSKLQELEKSIAEQDPLKKGIEQDPIADNIGTMMQAAGLDTTKSIEQEPLFEPGAGGAQVMNESAIGPGIEYRLRRWVQEEIQAAIPSILESLLQALEGTGGVDQTDGEKAANDQSEDLGLPVKGSL